jgi:hypothetical protein
MNNELASTEPYDTIATNSTIEDNVVTSNNSIEEALIHTTLMKTESMLTTFDNPFDPFTQFEAWYSFDLTSGYHTLALLGRLTFTSDELSEADQDAAIDAAIDEILAENVSGMHRRATREIPVESD